MAQGGTTPKGNGVWVYRDIEISVTDAGSFQFRADPKMDADMPERVPTLKEARERIDAILESEADAVKGTIAEPVILRVGDYVGDALFRGLHAGNGDAMLTLPDGQKIRAEREVIGLRGDSTVREEYLAKARELEQRRHEVRALDDVVRAIERAHGVSLRNGRINRDKARAARDSATIVAELRTKAGTGVS